MSRGVRADFYHSKIWETTARAYKTSVGGLCERCLQAGIIEPGVIVHHKQYLTDDNLADVDISLSFENLELLCRQCHADEHSSAKRKERNKNKRWSLDDEGNVIISEKENV